MWETKTTGAADSSSRPAPTHDQDAPTPEPKPADTSPGGGEGSSGDEVDAGASVPLSSAAVADKWHGRYRALLHGPVIQQMRSTTPAAYGNLCPGGLCAVALCLARRPLPPRASRLLPLPSSTPSSFSLLPPASPRPLESSLSPAIVFEACQPAVHPVKCAQSPRRVRCSRFVSHAWCGLRWPAGPLARPRDCAAMLTTSTRKTWRGWWTGSTPRKCCSAPSRVSRRPGELPTVC